MRIPTATGWGNPDCCECWTACGRELALEASSSSGPRRTRARGELELEASEARARGKLELGAPLELGYLENLDNPIDLAGTSDMWHLENLNNPLGSLVFSGWPNHL